MSAPDWEARVAAGIAAFAARAEHWNDYPGDLDDTGPGELLGNPDQPDPMLDVTCRQSIEGPPSRNGVLMGDLELTLFTKMGGPLTKRIMLENGSVKSDGSACIMTEGEAQRTAVTGAAGLAALMLELTTSQALSFGKLRSGLPNTVSIRTRARINGTTYPGLDTVIARTKENIVYEPDKPAWVLTDFDQKGMPPAVAQRIEDLGGVWPALVSVLPLLADTERVERASTSAGLYRTDTGEKLIGSGGVHLALLVRDGSDAERFLKTLHARCWLAGLGWLMVGAGGQLLERSIVDRVVWSPERLIFEGPPILVPPLAQDAAARRPMPIEGQALDTRAACVPLTIVERDTFQRLLARDSARLAPEIAKARSAFISRQAERLAKRTGISTTAARRTVERQCSGVLLPDLELPFDDPDLAGTTVTDVLADPGRFVGETLADPLEGIDYGRGKAKVMRRADGSVWIHSFAHGRTVYDLKYNYTAAAATLNNASLDDLAATFVALALSADLDPTEVERLRDLVHDRDRIGKRALDAMLKEARKQQRAADAEAAKEMRIAERQDARAFVPVPQIDAEWLPQINTINEVLGKSPAEVPPLRDADGACTEMRAISVPSLSRLAKKETNGMAEETRLPAPEQQLLVKMSEEEVAEAIERHIEYYVETEDGYRSVHLPTKFVRHFMKRHDLALPTATTVAQLPIVLQDGTMLAGPGLHRPSGVVFRIPPQLMQLLPNREDCSPTAVAEAMRFLCDEWLVDVAADYAGKCIIIACALTVIERALLPERPAFFITAGQRGGGKTTTIHIVSTAVLGIPACAAAWSKDEDERRKALLSYFSAGLPMLTWDNISRGSTISCPHIEKSLTNEFYSDRVLGESKHRLVLSSTVHVFTGNNITPRGDMASRSLVVRLAINRPDPENREFKHPDPLAWTQAHRGRILAALFTILLGNPRRSPGDHTPTETRFKTWWDMIGSAIEYAAEQHCRVAKEAIDWLVADPSPCPAKTFRFRELLLAGEEDEEQTSSLATVLDVLRRKWPNAELFQAREVADYAGRPDEESIAFKTALEIACGTPIKIVSATVINWRLKAITDAPVLAADKMVVLQYEKPHRSGRNGGFKVADLQSER